MVVLSHKIHIIRLIRNIINIKNKIIVMYKENIYKNKINMELLEIWQQ